MNSNEELAKLIKREISIVLEDMFGPLLLEIAKNMKSLKQEKEDEAQGSNLMTEIIAIKLQNQILKNQLDDISERLGLEIPESPSGSELMQKTSSSGRKIDETNIRTIVQEEIGAINTTILSEFENIDKILARFFKKTISDNKSIMNALESVKGSYRSESFESSPTPSVRETDQTNQVKDRPAITNQPSTQTSSRPVATSSSTPSSTRSYRTEQSVSQTYAPSTQASFTAAGKEQDSDIEHIQASIAYFSQGNIDPKDAIHKIENLRDSIIAERTSEAPYRVTASRMMREIIFALGREKSRRILTDGTGTHVIKQLEVLLDHVRGA